MPLHPVVRTTVFRQAAPSGGQGFLVEAEKPPRERHLVTVDSSAFKLSWCHAETGRARRGSATSSDGYSSSLRTRGPVRRHLRVRDHRDVHRLYSTEGDFGSLRQLSALDPH